MIYFIQAGDNGFIKIGYSDSVERRINQLQTASPVTLRVLLILDGDMELEAELHRKFRDFRTEGEWFYPVRPIREFIELYKSDFRPPIQKRIFSLDRTMITPLSLFELTLSEILITPPTILSSEYRKLCKKHGIEWVELAYKYQLDDNDDRNIGVVLDSNPGLLNEWRLLAVKHSEEIKALSPSYRKWLAQVEKKDRELWFSPNDWYFNSKTIEFEFIDPYIRKREYKLKHPISIEVDRLMAINF